MPIAPAEVLIPGTPGTRTSIETNGNDHHWEGGGLQPGLNYTYRVRGVVANQEEADRVAGQALVLQEEVLGLKTEMQDLRTQLANAQAALADAKKPKGKADT